MAKPTATAPAAAPDKPNPALPPEILADFRLVAGAAGMAHLPDGEHQRWKDALNRIAAAVQAGIEG